MRYPVPIGWVGAAALLLCAAAHADNFYGVRYDAATDELVVALVYRGTNPNHTFSLKWGQCKDTPGGSAPELAVEVLDSQWRDPAEHAFKKSIRLGLSDMPCRPAKVTLRMAPRFIYTLSIPAAGR